jgi:hypothetical protein
MRQGRGSRAWALGIAFGALCAACSSSSSDGSGQAGGASGNSAVGGMGAGGAVASAGAPGTGTGGSVTSAGADNSAGHSGAGTAGSSAAGADSGKVIAGYAGLCTPRCTGDEWCAGVEVSCDQKPCLIRAECRKSPACTATDQSNCKDNSLCLQVDATQCGSDASSTCELVCACRDPGCSFKNMVFNTDPAVCDCVAPPDTPSDCTIGTCPTGYVCNMLLGDAVCVTQATSP